MSQPGPPALRRTPLHAAHVRRGARMVPFAGWEMPVQYAGILEEHRLVRRAVGCFDVSHMGEFEVQGPDAVAGLQRLTTNDVAALAIGQVQYTLLCREDGGIVDDLTLARLGEDRYLLTVNASNIAKDWEWLVRHLEGRAHARDASTETGLIAVQGPGAEALVGRLAGADLGGLRYYRVTRGRVAGAEAWLARTGYTGEDGFEVYVAARDTERVWEALLEAGGAEEAGPAGLGARDTLRLEMAYPLYGNDLDETTNPIEAGLGWAVRLEKGPFLGRSAIERVRAEGPARRRVGFEMVDRAVPRHGHRILAAGRPVGLVTSGSYGPSVDRFIGMGYVETGLSAVGTEIEVEIRGRPQRARVVATPFRTPRVRR